MGIELKYLAAYLPYNVGFIKENSNRILKPYNVSYVINHNLKLILRPLSDLTKKIEVDGKNIVPMIELFKLEYELSKVQFNHVQSIEIHDNFYEIKYKHGEEIELNKNKVCINQHSYHLFQKLLELHFDIFGLIESGLAIDINTLQSW